MENKRRNKNVIISSNEFPHIRLLLYSSKEYEELIKAFDFWYNQDLYQLSFVCKAASMLDLHSSCIIIPSLQVEFHFSITKLLPNIIIGSRWWKVARSLYSMESFIILRILMLSEYELLWICERSLNWLVYSVRFQKWSVILICQKFFSSVICVLFAPWKLLPKCQSHSL